MLVQRGTTAGVLPRGATTSRTGAPMYTVCDVCDHGPNVNVNGEMDRRSGAVRSDGWW